MSYLTFALLASGGVAVYVLLAQGVVLIYRASGIINFAQGAFAMFGAYAFFETWQRGNWPLGLALVFSIGLTALLGASISILIISPLRRASPLVRVVATLAVTSLLTTAATIRYTDNLYQYAPFLPHRPLHFSGIAVPEDRLWLLAIAVLSSLGLHVLATRTSFGLATYGVSESEQTAETLGWSPRAIGALNWGLGGALAALAGILIVPLNGLAPGSLTLLMIPALAVALIGQFSSFGLALLGSVVLGVAQSEIVGHVTKPELAGLPAALPFLFIVGVTIFQGRGLPLRGYVQQRLPSLGSGRIQARVVIPFVAVAAVALLTLPASWIPYFIVTEIAMLFILAVVVLTGYAGQLSLAWYTIGGLAALCTGKLVDDAGMPFTIALFLGILGGTAAGLLCALPALRTRGVMLAVVTVGLAVAVYDTVFSNVQLTGLNSTTEVGPQTFLGINIDPILHPRSFALFVLAWLLAVSIVVGNIRRSRAGRRLIAVRTNERSAAALGVNIYVAKLFAFAVSAAVAGLGGVLLAFNGYAIVFTNYDPLSSIGVVQQSVLGGVGHITGMFFGGQFANGGVGTLIGKGIFGPGAFQWVALVGSAFVLVIILQNPNGLAPGHAVTGRPRGLKSALVPTLWLSYAFSRLTAVPPGESLKKASGDREGAARREPLPLNVRGASVSYGGISALSDVTVSVAPGEIVGLIGPNGAGKTTLIDVVSGFTKADSGSVELDAVTIDGWSASRRARSGVIRTFQGLELFEDLTVLDNIAAAADPNDSVGYLYGMFRPDRPVFSAETVSAIEDFGLTEYVDTPVRDLPYGRRRLVAIARALAADPAVLLLDEPTAGLDEEESSELAGILEKIPRERGTGILIVEHDMSVIMRLSTKVVVLDFGKVIAEGPPAAIRTNPRVVEAYLGAGAMDVPGGLPTTQVSQ